MVDGGPEEGNPSAKRLEPQDTCAALPLEYSDLTGTVIESFEERCAVRIQVEVEIEGRSEAVQEADGAGSWWR